jgi:hypothetical protein
MERFNRNVTQERFYRRYSAALTAAVLAAAIGFIAIAMSPQYTTAGERIGNASGAALLFGTIIFGAGWLLTLIKSQITGRIQRPATPWEPLLQPDPPARLQPAPAPRLQPTVLHARPR